MPQTASRSTLVECVPQNALTDSGEIVRFYDCCTEFTLKRLDP
jgi:hypothetical protein